MYSYEIDTLMRESNYNIPSEIYIKILNESMQIDHVKYSSYGGYFEIWTTDNYYWKFNVFRKD